MDEARSAGSGKGIIKGIVLGPKIIIYLTCRRPQSSGQKLVKKNFFAQRTTPFIMILIRYLVFFQVKNEEDTFVSQIASECWDPVLDELFTNKPIWT
jgi:hypothetical protein